MPVSTATTMVNIANTVDTGNIVLTFEKYVLYKLNESEMSLDIVSAVGNKPIINISKSKIILIMPIVIINLSVSSHVGYTIK